MVALLAAVLLCRMALLEGHIGPVWSLSYSKGSGSVLATGGADRTVRLFSCPRGENIMELVNHELIAGEEAVAEYHSKAAAGLGAEPPRLPGAGTSSTRGRGAGASAAAGAQTTAAAAAQGASGGAHAHGHGHAPSWQPYLLLKTFTTQSMPVVHVEFSSRNLLLAGGPWQLQPKVISSAQHVAAAKGR
jgi:WD40 repeat protein